MKILVCLKQVPDANARLVPASSPGWSLIEEENVAFVANEFDLYALEMALQLKDADASREIVVASAGPERAKQAVRKALAMGADRAVQLQDEAFAGADPWSTATALAAVAAKEGPFDLVLTGLQAWDDAFGQTGPILAEKLGVPCATGIMAWKLEGSRITVERELDGDRREVVHLPLPCVLTVQTGAGGKAPRYENIKGIMGAKKKELKTPSPGDLGLQADAVGRGGARVKVSRIAEPPRQAGAEMLNGSAQDMAREIVRRIREKTGLV